MVGFGKGRRNRKPSASSRNQHASVHVSEEVRERDRRQGSIARFTQRLECPSDYRAINQADGQIECDASQVNEELQRVYQITRLPLVPEPYR
jgi:hypothetical protein